MEGLRAKLKDIRESWTLCGHCGACFYRGPIVPHNWRELPPPEWSSPSHKCPSFEYFKFRAYSALGIGNLAAVVFHDDQFPITDDLMKVVYACTSCGMCSEVCPAFQPFTVIRAFREELIQRGGQLPEPLQKLHENIISFGNIFGARRIPEIFQNISASHGEDLYFAGCEVRIRKPKIAEATVKVLRTLGINVACLGEREKCCGFVAGHDGKIELMEERAVENIKTIKETGAKRLIVSCAHCYKAFKIDYPQIVGKLPFEVIHVAELFADLIDQNKMTFAQNTDQEIRKVTYQDPCFLGRHSGVYDEPRRVLESIPGIELVEMERHGRWSYCCGSGAKITESCYPEFADDVTEERLQEAKRAADIVVTACSSCFSTMNRAAKKSETDVKVYDLSILVAEAMGIELESAL